MNRNTFFKGLTVLALCWFVTAALNAQKIFSLGSKQAGIGFGSTERYAGLRFNFRDTFSGNTSGAQFTFISRSTRHNGLSVGLFSNLDEWSNGVSLGGVASQATRKNGISLAGIFNVGQKMNGLHLAGLAVIGDTLNGVFMGGYGVTSWSPDDQIDQINGLAVAFLGVDAQQLRGVAVSGLLNQFEKQKGVSVGLFNVSDELHGIQIGLLNIAKNNRKGFRYLPFFNVHIKKA